MSARVNGSEMCTPARRETRRGIDSLNRITRDSTSDIVPHVMVRSSDWGEEEDEEEEDAESDDTESEDARYIVDA